MIGRKFTELTVEPKLNDWAPYIGPRSRMNANVLNSEHRKIHRDTGTPEADCRDMSHERLLEELYGSKTNDIKKLARKINVSTQGSKLDILNRVR